MDVVGCGTRPRRPDRDETCPDRSRPAHDRPAARPDGDLDRDDPDALDDDALDAIAAGAERSAVYWFARLMLAGGGGDLPADVAAAEGLARCGVSVRLDPADRDPADQIGGAPRGGSPNRTPTAKWAR